MYHMTKPDLKVTFFRKCYLFFKSPKQIFQITILSLNKLLTGMGGKFKFQVQDEDSDLEYFFWRFDTFWKEATFSANRVNQWLIIMSPRNSLLQIFSLPTFSPDRPDPKLLLVVLRFLCIRFQTYNCAMFAAYLFSFCNKMDFRQ